MLYWAAIPLEIVFEGFDTMKCEWIETEYQGVKMVVEPTNNGTGKIIRLLSPIPSDYLKPYLAPGSIVPVLSS